MPARFRGPIVVALLAVSPALRALPPAAPPTVRAQESPSPPTALIAGRVVEGLTSTGVAGAVLTLRDRQGLRKAVVTDASGTFAVSGLPAGDYDLSTQKPGYTRGTYDQRRPAGGGRRLALGQGQQRVDVPVPLWKEAAASGIVVDETGEPLVGHRVEAWGSFAGGGRLVSGSVTAALTDDRGVYRLHGLAARRYLIIVPSTQMNTARGLAPFYPTQFYAGTRTANGAIPLDLQAGEHRRGVDFRLVPARLQRVTGRLDDSSGGSTGNMTVTLALAEDSLASEIEEATTVSRPDGTFVFDEVPPGNYTLKVLNVPAPSGGVGVEAVMAIAVPVPRPARTSDGSGRWVLVSLSVADEPITDLRVPLLPGLRITGQLAFEGDRPPPSPDQLQKQVRVLLGLASGRRVEGLTSAALAAADRAGAFETVPVPAGRYVISALAPMPWTLQSIRLAGRDVTGAPLALTERDLTGLVVTFTDKPASLTGVVRGADRLPDPAAMVLVFPTDPALWIDFGNGALRLRSARAGDAGDYAINALPPGEYFAAAAREEHTVTWQTQASLQALARVASRVRVGAGETVTTNLDTLARLDP